MNIDRNDHFIDQLNLVKALSSQDMQCVFLLKQIAISCLLWLEPVIWPPDVMVVGPSQSGGSTGRCEVFVVSCGHHELGEGRITSHCCSFRQLGLLTNSLADRNIPQPSICGVLTVDDSEDCTSVTTDLLIISPM